jgi:MFS family permease
VISAATSFTNNFHQLYFVRLLLGAGEAVVTPASLRWIRFNVGEHQRGLAVGLLFAGAKLGPAIAAPLAGVLLMQFGWRSMFVILGLGALLWLIPWMLLVKDDYREFVERRHLSIGQMGKYTAFSFTGMAFVAIAAGWFADRLIAAGGDPVKIRKRFTIAGFVVASTELFGALSDSNDVALLFAIISLAGLGLATANYWALTQSLMPGAAIGRIAGVQNFASNLSGVAAPLITGWLKQSTGKYEAPMQAVWFFLITGIASYGLLVRRKYAR